nr:hypothetical protein [uncultured Psychroserpens sp.]
METIGIDKLKTFWKYYEDFELMYDSRYVDKRKILKEISEEEIRIISALEYHYFLINAEKDSKQLVDKYQKVIDEYKNKVTSEVLEYLKKEERPEIEIEEKESWFKKLFNSSKKNK